GREGHALGPEPGTEPPSGGLDDSGLASRAWTQAVVDVDGGDHAARLGGQGEQCQRVGSPRDGAGEVRARRRERAAAQEVTENRPHLLLTRRTQLGGSRISSRDGRASGALHANPNSSGPPADSTAATNRSPSSYWRILASRPISCWSTRAGPRTCRRRSRSTLLKRSALGIRAAPARAMVTSPWPSSRLIRPCTLLSTACCSVPMTSPGSPPSDRGVRPMGPSAAVRLRPAGN